MLISAKKVNSVSNNLQVINNPLDIELKFNGRPHPFKVFEESLLPKLLSLERDIMNALWKQRTMLLLHYTYSKIII